MRSLFCVLAASCLLASAAQAETSPAAQALDGTYTYTGTATVLAGGSNCVATSPASIVGDAVVASHGYSVLLHITTSTNTAGVLMDMKSNNFPLVSYTHQASGTDTFALVPQSKTYSGTFAMQATKGTSAAVPFTAKITFAGPPFILGKTGSCQVGLALSFMPGVSKPLLKLLQGVL